MEEGAKLWLVFDLEKGKMNRLEYEFPNNTEQYQIDVFNMGLCSMFPSYSFFNGKAQPSSVIYLDNQSQ